MRGRLLRDRAVRILLFTEGVVAAVFSAFLLLSWLRTRWTTGAFEALFPFLLGTVLATLIAVGVRVRYEWRTQPALMIGYAVMLAVLAALPVYSLSLAGRVVLVIVALMVFVVGLCLRAV